MPDFNNVEASNLNEQGNEVLVPFRASFSLASPSSYIFFSEKKFVKRKKNV